MLQTTYSQLCYIGSEPSSSRLKCTGKQPEWRKQQIQGRKGDNNYPVPSVNQVLYWVIHICFLGKFSQRVLDKDINSPFNNDKCASES